MTSRLDAHVHLWNRALDPQDWIDPETMAPIDQDFGTGELATMLAETGMDKAIVVQASNSVDESIRLAQSDPTVVAGLVAWVDLTQDVGPQLERILATASVPIVGVRHLAHIDPDPAWLLREDVARGLNALEQAGLCFDLVLRHWQLSQAAHVASRHQGLRLVLDHLGGPPPPDTDATAWESGFRDLAGLPNVVAKVSGLTSGLVPGSWTSSDLRPVVETALEVFGPERLMYGTDWPLAELGGGAGIWKTALETLLKGASEDAYDRLFGTTAVEVYLQQNPDGQPAAR
ncbi:amidohydrolase family protein [Arthrobacter sp. B2a2-09]|uniref:amidohydrolase family protein n=1 Tax=Arthrobacter sp. B2a2-09 TaxID=2952822 RepID=UPI0022CD3150|nr:amidohydrolase family protein [Arthrobacter sp. B2a2-09]MCZ9881201.1 amidohydrolase family protein [Arthrobacter sp. B2a2-09]